MLQKPLYRFLCEAFTQWPTENTASLSPLLTLWVTYLTPWTLEFPKPFRVSRSSGSPTSTLSRGLEAVTAVATERSRLRPLSRTTRLLFQARLALGRPKRPSEAANRQGTRFA